MKSGLIASMLRSLALAALAAGAVLQCAAAAEVGKPSPEFAIRYNDGTQKLLSSFRGKVVCLMFVHTTCPHCQHDSQVINQLYQQYGSKGFQPLAVAWNDMANMLVPDFVKTFSISFPVGFAPREEVLTYLGFSAYDRTVVPQIAWIDRKGIVRAQTPPAGDNKQLDEAFWHQMIDTLTAEPGPSTSHHPAHRAAKKVAAATQP